MAHSDLQAQHYQQAKASLQQALSWYGSFSRHGHHAPSPELQAAVRPEVQQIQGALDKLEKNIIRIATFGLVSRGKSAVVNALLGEKILETGPLHGVTQWPRSLRWTPPSGKVQIDLIDTPGLDEIAGEQRETMAQTVAYGADLILFVVAGDLTRREYEALQALRQSHKPLILVFNKIDLYPDCDRQSIHQQLQEWGRTQGDPTLEQQLTQQEIVLIAAEPQPQPVRVEYADGQVEESWETPPPQIDELRDRILELLNREGRSLLALNALIQARDAEQRIASKTLALRDGEAEELIWQYAKYKALAIAVNPLAVLDVLGGVVADLALIRALARLYGLPMTSYEAIRVWRRILFSAGGVALGELVTSVLLGMGKSLMTLGSVFENPTAFTLYGGTALSQGAIAAYGAYRVGKTAQAYLQRGCSWGAIGTSQVMQTIIEDMDGDTMIDRFRGELAP